jgi:hypothetical protein
VARLAALLGEAAAPNLIVGSTDRAGAPVFDEGDEVVCFDAQGLPVRILVSDHTGTFMDFTSSFSRLAPAYALPVNSRAAWLPDARAFAEAYLAAFTSRFAYIQSEYNRHRRGFRALFRYRPRDEKGSFAYRWERILDRLEAADPAAVEADIRNHLTL